MTGKMSHFTRYHLRAWWSSGAGAPGQRLRVTRQAGGPKGKESPWSHRGLWAPPPLPTRPSLVPALTSVTFLATPRTSLGVLAASGGPARATVYPPAAEVTLYG